MNGFNFSGGSDSSSDSDLSIDLNQSVTELLSQQPNSSERKRNSFERKESNVTGNLEQTMTQNQSDQINSNSTPKKQRLNNLPSHYDLTSSPLLNSRINQEIEIEIEKEKIKKNKNKKKKKKKDKTKNKTKNKKKNKKENKKKKKKETSKSSEESEESEESSETSETSESEESAEESESSDLDEISLTNLLSENNSQNNPNSQQLQKEPPQEINFKKISKLKLDKKLQSQKKIPGPAGLLPDLDPEEDLPVSLNLLSQRNESFFLHPKQSEQENQNSSELLEQNSKKLQMKQFIDGPWKNLIEEVEHQGLDTVDFFKYDICYVKEQHPITNKVPWISVIIERLQITDSHLGQATLIDPSGRISGTIHGTVLSEYASQISVGTVLTLKTVTVFSPKRDEKHLNITPSNLFLVLPPTKDEKESSQKKNTQKRKSLNLEKDQFIQKLSEEKHNNENQQQQINEKNIQNQQNNFPNQNFQTNQNNNLQQQQQNNQNMSQQQNYQTNQNMNQQQNLQNNQNINQTQSLEFILNQQQNNQNNQIMNQQQNFQTNQNTNQSQQQQTNQTIPKNLSDRKSQNKVNDEDNELDWGAIEKVTSSQQDSLQQNKQNLDPQSSTQGYLKKVSENKDREDDDDDVDKYADILDNFHDVDF
ncbi:hypothetical protein M0812_01731 [Anaeramoeba flamelloides]|uniref:Homologous recombination OB-fold protein OB-fold domain-containing protein n=1 Tax=Anaeramoeba flamelloides TaxID=1746091 RepID=A0AAV7Z3C6_9EUKA|nr:hypothetical protein M0812_01731 [Anaeramoeba flamelloides]